MNNPFNPEIAVKIIDLLESEGLDEFHSSLHAAAVVCGLCPTTSDAIKLIQFIGNQADQPK